MEILQTIWTALTNENEMLVNNICIPLTFLEKYLTMKIFTYVLNIDCNKQQEVFYVISFSLISINIIYSPHNLYFLFVRVLQHLLKYNYH